MSYNPPIYTLDVSWIGSATYQSPKDRVLGSWSTGSTKYVLQSGWVNDVVFGATSVIQTQITNAVGIEPYTAGVAYVYLPDSQVPRYQFVVDASWVGEFVYSAPIGIVRASWSESEVYINPSSVNAGEVFGRAVVYGTQFAVPVGWVSSVAPNRAYVLFSYEYAPPQYVLNASWVGEELYSNPQYEINASWTLPKESTIIATTGWQSGGIGVHTIYRLTQNITEVGWQDGAFGVATLSKAALGIFAEGIAPTSVVGRPFIAYRIRYLYPYGALPARPGLPEVRNWIRYIEPESGVFTEFGYAQVTPGERAVYPSGFVSSSLGLVDIQNLTRYYNLIGWSSSIVAVGARVWDGNQYLWNVTLGDGSFVPWPIFSEPVAPPDKTQYLELSSYGIKIPDNQVWPAHKIENLNQNIYTEGFIRTALGYPVLTQEDTMRIGVLGREYLEFGIVTFDVSDHYLYAEGFTEAYVSPNSQIYNARIDVVAGGFLSYVSGAHTVYRGTVRIYTTGIASVSAVSRYSWVSYRIRHIEPAGLYATRWGTALLQSSAIDVLPGGIAPPPSSGFSGRWQVPAPEVDFWVRYIEPGGIRPNIISYSHTVTHELRYIDFAGRGPGPESFGFARIEHRYRYIYPTFVASMEFGWHRVARLLYVYPGGWESSFLTENNEVVMNTRRIYVNTGEADPAKYGTARISDAIQEVILDRYGWEDSTWNYPVVYNLKQEVFVGPFADNLNPEEWVHYYPWVEHRDRTVKPFGSPSSRFGIGIRVYNAGISIKPEGLDATLWGLGTFIAYRHRELPLPGWDSFISERYTVIWNAAEAILPTAITPSLVFGRAEVSGINQLVKQHSGWEGPIWGTPFVAYAVRTVYTREFIDVPNGIPEVRHNPYPISPAGIPWQGQVGGHEVRIFMRIVKPFSLNVHDLWAGHADVKNRNIVVYPYGYEQTEFGETIVENYIRYIYTHSVYDMQIPKPYIGRRDRTIVPVSLPIPEFPRLHRIRNESPDPPSTRTIDLSKTTEFGQIADGYGIAPDNHQVSRAAIRLSQIWAEGIYDARFGQPRVFANAILPLFFNTGTEVGEPTLVFTQYIFAEGIKLYDYQAYGTPRMSPFHIYAPSGSERPHLYTPGSVGMVIDAWLYADDGSSHPWFGVPTILGYSQYLTGVPYHGERNDWLAGATRFGDTYVFNRTTYVYPPSIRSLRVGFPILDGIEQYVNLDDINYGQGIPSKFEVGEHVVEFYVDPMAPKYIVPSGLNALRWGQNSIELFNRQIYPKSVNHGGNPQQGYTSPWGVPTVGFPREYEVGMGVQTIWGSNSVEFKDRPVYPEGWLSCTLEDWNFENFRFPMRVYRTNPRTIPGMINSESVFGIPSITHRLQPIRPTGFVSLRAGWPVLTKRQSIWPQGWESMVFGDIAKWEDGKIKPHGDDMSVFGTAHIKWPVWADGIEDWDMGEPSVFPAIAPLGIPAVQFVGPTLTDVFGCNNRAIAPMPMPSTSVVAVPSLH